MEATESCQKIYPSVEELCKTTKGSKCPECSALFNSDSHLNLHLAKTHKKAELLQQNSANKVYHCPITSCSYHSASSFKNMRYLRQHYLKVHTEKKFICVNCNKGFPTEIFCNRHREYCSTVFKCCDCEAFYESYETLKTHSRRKKHKILEKSAYKPVGLDNLKLPKSETSISNSKVVLLKVSKSTGMMIDFDTSEQSSQTEKARILRATQETQTSGLKMLHMTVETQTIGDYYTAKKNDSIALKTSKTQTNLIEPKTVSCNTHYDIAEIASSSDISDIQRSSSSTQTNISDCDLLYSSSTSTHDSIHTDTSDLFNDTLDSNYFNCHMETQTDFMLNDELFKYCDFYSNTHTQTCSDLLLGEIGLSDTHTQTVFDDVLKSVESQTVMSKRLPLTCKDMSHMQTQTDVEYKKILEEINA